MVTIGTDVVVAAGETIWAGRLTNSCPLVLDNCWSVLGFNPEMLVTWAWASWKYAEYVDKITIANPTAIIPRHSTPKHAMNSRTATLYYPTGRVEASRFG